MVTRKSTKDSAVLRGTQEIYDGDDGADGGSGPLKTVDMSFISNVTSFVDGSGVGHVKVNDSMDWSEILRNDTTVHIVYEGSGSNKEILIFPVNETTSGSTDLSSTGSSGSDSTSGSGTVSPVDSLPTSSSGDSSSGGSEGVVGTGSTPTTLVIVASILAVIAIAAVFAVVMYGRRNRRRAFSEDPSNPDEPFIVGSLPHQPAPQLSMLDTDMTPDLWVEGQYQYSPNESGLQNSLNGTAILSDNNTTPSHHRLTVDAYPFGPNTRRGHREDGSRPRDNTYRSRREDGSRPRDNTYRSHRGNITPPLDDISERGRHRRGTTPVVLFEQDSIEEHNTNSSRKYPRQPSLQHQPRQPSQQRQQSQRGPSQQRRAHRDKYATRRDR